MLALALALAPGGLAKVASNPVPNSLTPLTVGGSCAMAAVAAAEATAEATASTIANEVAIEAFSDSSDNSARPQQPQPQQQGSQE